MGILTLIILKIEEPSIPINFESINTINNLPKFPYNETQTFEIINNNIDNVVKNSKIAIVSLSIGKRDFAKISKNRLETYTELHGYSLEYFDKVLDDKYEIMWQKVIAVIQTLNKKENGEYKYDAVFWIDDDAYITNTSYPLEVFMNLTDKDIILSRDCPMDDINVYINSGTYIIKNTETGRNFMNDLINNYNIYKGYFQKKLFHEQSVMIYLYLTKYINQCEILPFNILQSHNNYGGVWKKIAGKGQTSEFHRGWKYKDFIIHLAGVKKDNRSKIMNKLTLRDDFLIIKDKKYPVTSKSWNIYG